MNKLNTVSTYNAWNVQGGRLQNLTSTRPADGTTLQNLTYNYDSVGNILTITDSLSGPQTQTFQYDALDRLVNSNVTGGTYGLYSEGYTYDGTTGNLSSKNSVNYTYNTTHKHAVASLSNGNSYSYDANGNMTQRVVGGQTYNLSYDAENRLVSVTGAATASFVYDADGKQVKTVVNGVTTYYVGSHYEVKNSVVTKYYFAGATRLAVRTGGTLSFLLADHIGSSSLTTDANGLTIGESLYKAFGESRYLSGTLNTDYKFTGQREESALGIYWFQSRWMDPSLGRFTQPDSIVPTSTQGTQAWDRYGFVNNNPVRYNDPTGHMATNEQCGYQMEECHFYEHPQPQPPTVTIPGKGGAGTTSRWSPLPFNVSISYTTPPFYAGPFSVTGSLEVRTLTGSQTTFTLPMDGPVVMKQSIPLSPNINLNAENNGTFSYIATGPATANGMMIKTEAGINPVNNTWSANVITTNSSLYVKTGVTVSSSVDPIDLAPYGVAATALALGAPSFFEAGADLYESTVLWLQYLAPAVGY